MRTYPLIPNVEGKIYEKYLQNAGMAVSGHEIPERKSKGTDVNTNNNIHVSRLRMAMEAVIAKKIQAPK